jgi:cytochrome c oxidase cbb3-type subunit 2
LQESPSLYALRPTPRTRLQPVHPICFTALVWLDSAAFFIIQNIPTLKAGTWQGSAHLWANGCLHLTAALAAAWFLRRRGLSFLLSAAFLALGSACLLLLDPTLAGLASVLYPVGVSLYSVALVAYPSLIAPASSVAERGRQAGWIYALAGWCGSVMGIGMGQNLGYVPPAFVLAAGAVVLLPALFSLLEKRKREMALALVTLLAAVSIEKALVVAHNTPPLTQIERGRRVYISEGCINCHSQYIRPNSPDVLLWGPAGSLEQLRHERPPLIGNRRQGPDLSEIGGRRSPLWLKAHFFNPPEVSGASIMPPFAFLFRDGRGDDLVAYLQSLHGPGTTEHQAAEKLWHPSFSAVAKADASDGEPLFHRNCATCHSADGRTRQTWKSGFTRLPPDLATGPFTHLPPTDSKAQRMDRLAQIAKFGIPGTDMPGHEYLSDRDIASICLWLLQIDARPVRTDNLAFNRGEEE